MGRASDMGCKDQLAFSRVKLRAVPIDRLQEGRSNDLDSRLCGGPRVSDLDRAILDGTGFNEVSGSRGGEDVNWQTCLLVTRDGGEPFLSPTLVVCADQIPRIAYWLPWHSRLLEYSCASTIPR